eukprot:CAMPEP_0119295906 /NCGR_PEP_ID=MMETSP1329-20130426/50299_1 /TAXON_ID=114041 /ORGANISM="Genus nov. species nov., Strain RCC1024" /LENGTH=178 /DNA_ID=CAMNT_0007296829 /DNA_START=1176 /DNA_END=1709 /DNA_ORIENTATION=-
MKAPTFIVLAHRKADGKTPKPRKAHVATHNSRGGLGGRREVRLGRLRVVQVLNVLGPVTGPTATTQTPSANDDAHLNLDDLGGRRSRLSSPGSRQPGSKKRATRGTRVDELCIAPRVQAPRLLRAPLPRRARLVCSPTSQDLTLRRGLEPDVREGRGGVKRGGGTTPERNRRRLLEAG